LELMGRNLGMIDLVHNVYEYAETREPSDNELVREIAPLIDEEKLTGEQAVKMLVMGMIFRMQRIVENPDCDADDMVEIAHSLSDLASIVLYLRLTQRADEAFLDDTSELIAKMTRLLDDWHAAQEGANCVN